MTREQPGDASSGTAAPGIWEVAERCGICGSPDHAPVFRVFEKRYVRCGGCSVVRLLDRVAPSRLDLIYGSFYDSAPVSPDELEEQLRNPTFAARRRRLERFLEPGRREIFEIGCGDGNFLAYLRRAGWKVAGSEFGSATAAVIRSRHGIEVAVGDFAALAVPPGSLAAAGCYHVLEHLYDPLAFLRAVRRALRDGGIFHVQVPNFRCLDRMVAGPSAALVRFPEHVYFYEPRPLRALLRRVGFETLETSTYDPWHGPGSTLASARSLIRRWVTGRSPWSDVVERPAGAAAPSAPPPRPSLATRVFDAAAFPLALAAARGQSLAGLGNVIDLVLRAGAPRES